MTYRSAKPARKTASKASKSVTKTGKATFLGVTILEPHFKPKNTTVEKIRAAVRAANARRQSA
jgi:hypothetical protein